MPRYDQMRWQQKLEKLGFYVGTGAACSNISKATSRGIDVLGVDAAAHKRILRMSGGVELSKEDWLALADALVAISKELAMDAALADVIEL
ncbi:MAG: hypothetical protein B7X06_01935 [Verrucomicrobia bacterium 21-51-4]|nr:MAG: hypothetical protein B7X06_01935 [Verrucomicrobia bacterium 21-51-4]